MVQEWSNFTDSNFSDRKRAGAKCPSGQRRGKLIGKEILRHEDTLDVGTRNNLDFITSNWVTLWHGTKSSNIESILRYALLPSGTKLQNGFTIKPPNGHIRLGVKHFGFDDWAYFLFLS